MAKQALLERARALTYPLLIVLGIASSLVLPSFAEAQSEIAAEETIISHGYNFFEPLKYDSAFEHLEYVNPEAPKGGEISFSFLGTFDSFNPFSAAGRSAVLSSDGLESLLIASADEIGSYYGLVAESIEYPPSLDWVIFTLRENARFADGSDITADDVVFTHELFIREGLPSYSAAVSTRISSAEALDEHRVRFSFFPESEKRGRIELAGGTPVMSRAWFERTGTRLNEPSTIPILGSGPYILDEYEFSRRVVYRYNPDYWGRDLPINRGRNNFERIRIEYFADQNAAFEAFKSGVYTFRQEGSSLNWATKYDFPALDRGDVIRETLPNGATPPTSGWYFNLNREKFSDPRVREAISLAYNFEWTNQNLQYSLFKQRHSFFQNSDVEAMGIPEGLELEVLQSLGDLISEELLTAPVVMAHSSGERQTDRRNLRRANQLLDEAGWEVDASGRRRNAAGETLDVTILSANPGFDRITLPIIENLRAMGVNAEYDRVDYPQYTLRTREKDFDIVYGGRSSSPRPGGGLWQLYGTLGAEDVFNESGLSDPAIDAVIEKVVHATEIEPFRASVRALDRLLRHKRFVIPAHYNDAYWLAYYDMYRYPENLPPYDLGFLDLWWFDAEAAEELRESGAIR